MEPDEATDALRDLGPAAEDLLLAMPAPRAAELRNLLGYDSRVAGGLMTSQLTLVDQHDTVRQVRDRLRDEVDRAHELDAVLVVDHAGLLVDDVTLFELLVAPDDATMASLVGPPVPAIVSVDQPLREVLDAFRDARGSSVVVVGPDDRPVGRIMADDLIDALSPDDGRRWAFTS
jgi:Mg/Co/Ni transporter MgtE